MSRRVLNVVHPGQIWRDRDRRMMSGNRRVRVISVISDPGVVEYRQVVGLDEAVGQIFKSSYGRFQRAFDLLGPTGVR